MTPINTFLGSGTPVAATSPTFDTGSSSIFPSFSSIPDLNSVSLPSIPSVSSVVGSVLFSSRLVAIVLGLIFIAGAIVLYVGEDVADAIGLGSKRAVVGKAVDALS